MKTIKIGSIEIGKKGKLVLIAGPCVIETERSALRHAEKLKKLCNSLKLSFIYKSSYDKANRSSLKSYRGPGLKKGLAILQRVKDEFDIPVLSDVHCQQDVERAAEVLDIIQVPAFLSRQTDFLLRAGKSGVTVNIKKGQFLSPYDVKNVIEKVESTGNKKIFITERGTSFGYNNLVSDMRALPIMRGFGYPVIYDATHSVQLPGAAGTSSSGERKFAAGLSRAAVAMGCDGLFLEVHESPDKAPCDGPNMLKLPELKKLLEQVIEIERIVCH